MSWPYIISVFCLVFCCFSFIYFRSFLKRKTSFEGILKDVREEVSRLLRSLDDITDKNITLIEDREKRLKELLEETDRRLTVYFREIDRRDKAERTYREMGTRIIKENAVSKPLVSESQVPTPTAAPASPTPANAPIASVEEQIRELTRQGVPPEKIASRLGISVSEAEFVADIEARKTRG